MPNIRVVATFTTADEAKLVALAKPMIAATRKEEGCISYDLQKNIQEETKFAFIEEWSSNDHLDAHLLSDHIKTFVEGLKDIKMIETPNIMRFASLNL